MAIYKIYLRSFAPWKEFGAFTKERSVHVPAPPRGPWGLGQMPSSMPIKFGGSYHGDGRGFSLDTKSPDVTARVNAFLEVDLTTLAGSNRRVWCDESFGPWMGFGPADRGFSVPTSTISSIRIGTSLTVVLEYGAPNPLFKGAPKIDARGEYVLTPGAGTLQIDAVITGDQFPACESFIEDPREAKIFVGGFGPESKDQILRLYGSMNDPKKIWFQSHMIISIDDAGNFLTVQGGGSGSNATSPTSKGLGISIVQWNRRIMHSIPMPRDAGL